MKIFLFVLLFPMFVFSQGLELTNTEWELSAVGCMDSSLSYSSYRTKPPSSADITAGKLKFIGIDRVEVTEEMDGEEITQRVTYTINGDELNARGANDPIYIRENNRGENILVFIGNSFESWDNCACPYKEELESEKYYSWTNDDYFAEHRRLRHKCKEEYPFVYIIGRVK